MHNILKSSKIDILVNNDNNIIQSILKARNSYNCTVLYLKIHGKNIS